MSTSISTDVHELQKWLNEEPNRPLDKQALGRLLHAVTAAKPVGVIVTDSDGEIVLGDEVSWANGMPAPGTKLYAAPPWLPDLTPEQLADKCEAWLQTGTLTTNVVDAYEAGYRDCEAAHAAAMHRQA